MRKNAHYRSVLRLVWQQHGAIGGADGDHFADDGHRAGDAGAQRLSELYGAMAALMALISGVVLLLCGLLRLWGFSPTSSAVC